MELALRARRKAAGRLALAVGQIWLKAAENDPTALRRVFEAAQDQEVFEPIAWITAALVSRAKASAPFEQTDEHGWRVRFASHQENGVWPEKWGGNGPGDHPGHPPWLAQLASRTSTLTNCINTGA